MARALLAVLILAASLAAQAQSWPSKPIRLVVPYPPGGSTDVTARTLAERVSSALGQPALVEHNPGTRANIGHQ